MSRPGEVNGREMVIENLSGVVSVWSCDGVTLVNVHEGRVPRAARVLSILPESGRVWRVLLVLRGATGRTRILPREARGDT